jgi:hypothetical protein
MCPLDTLEIFYKFFTYFWLISFNKEAKDHKVFLTHVFIKKGKLKKKIVRNGINEFN